MMHIHHASKIKGLLWVGIACVFGLLLAFGISPLARAIPWTWEKQLANTIDLTPSVETCPLNPMAEGLLQRIVKRLYPVHAEDADYSIEVRVVKESTINAFASLGGQIVIFSGLLKQAESPEEIAGVLAHEIEHVRHRHIIEGAFARLLTAEGINLLFGGYSSAAEWSHYFLNMGFTRSQEAKADEEGLKRLRAAQIDNQGFKRFFERMEQSQRVPAFLSDHPSDAERKEMVSRFSNHDTKPIMTTEEWKTLKQYCQ